MNDGKTLKEHYREEVSKLKAMSFHEKRQHIWEYYKLHLFAIVVIIFFTGSIINSILNPAKREYLYIAWLGHGVPFAQLDNLAQELNVIVYDYERYRVVVTSYSATGSPQEDMAIQSRFAGLMAMGEIDIIMSTLEGVRELTEVGWIRPLDDVLVYLPELSDERMLWLAPEYLPNPAVMGISLAGSSLLGELWLMPEDLYLTIVINASRPYEVSKALRVMLDEL